MEVIINPVTVTTQVTTVLAKKFPLAFLIEGKLNKNNINVPKMIEIIGKHMTRNIVIIIFLSIGKTS